MKFLLLSIGTRGDAEPFLAVGVLLQQAGHEVVIALPAQFRPLAEDAGLAFAPLDERFLELLESETATNFMGQKGSWFTRLNQLRKLSKDSLAVQRNMVAEQQALFQQHQPDRVVYHPKCLLARSWGMANPGRAIGISPVPNWLHPVSDYPHIALDVQLGGWGNRQTYRLINFVTALMTARYGKPFRADYAGTDLSRRATADYMAKRERMLYLISPSLYPRPAAWPAQAKVMGYFERPKTGNWMPSTELTDFLARYAEQRVTFITFGSMVNATPVKTTAAIVKVLNKHRLPAIINTSSGGLQPMADAPDHIHFVSSIPYEWIFPRVQDVVHHGGSGTVHTATKHGKPSLIFPHIVDQFFWNRRIADLGLGPLGVKVKQLDESTFEALLLQLRNTPAYAKTATAFAEAMAGEAAEVGLLEELTK